MATGPNTADLDAVTELAIAGAQIDGDHHKQWYLVRILKALGMDQDDLDALMIDDHEMPN